MTTLARKRDKILRSDDDNNSTKPLMTMVGKKTDSNVEKTLMTTVEKHLW